MTAVDFPCTSCSRSFRTQQGLHAHQRVHRKELEADSDGLPDAPPERRTDPRAAEVALSERLQQSENLKAQRGKIN